MVAVLFVCMGNICRSPMAEGAFRAALNAADLDEHIEVDSAGTIGYHAGSKPDPRAQTAARDQGINITQQRSRKVATADFETFDYIMAMDRENLSDLMAMCPEEHQHRISLFLPFAPHLQYDEMPDPYYGHDDQFAVCFKAATDAAEGLLAHISNKHFAQK